MKPKLTRRRILIAAIAVVGLLVVWWSRSRRIDERFVGRWLAYNKRNVFVIRPDGSGMMIDILDPAAAESPLTYRIRDGYLDFRGPPPDFEGRLTVLKHDVIEIVTGELSGRWWRRRIIAVHQDSIVLEDPQVPDGIVMSRVNDDSPSAPD